jgi:hypothetical protein
MNDLFFVRYQAKLMLLDSMDMPREVELAHRRLADFIWTMDGPPRDVDVTLIVEICRTTISEWPRIKEGLELKGWHSDGNGCFTHDKIMATLLEAKEIHKAAHDRTKLATAVRMKRDVKRDVKRDDIVTFHQSESESVQYKQTNNGHPKLEEVLAAASMTGMLPTDATDFWNHFEASGWIDKNGNRIVNWRSKMATWKTIARAATAESLHNSSGGQRPRSKSVYELKTILDTKKQMAQELKSGYCAEVGMGEHWKDNGKHNEFRQLNREIKQLSRTISSMT